jgi:hypothetical protein
MKLLVMTVLVLVAAVSVAVRTATATNLPDTPVVVSFVFPGGVIKSTDVTDNEVRDLLHENLGYMIEWWVRGALAKLGLPHVITVVDQKSKATAVTSVDGVTSGPAGRWVLYVDGIRSRYHINTQVRQNEHQIRLVYEHVGRPAG